jgi:hypothetical protein
MAHYARVNADNIVTYVTPIPNEMITDENGVEHEERALPHLYSTISESVGDRWIQTSFNNNFRSKFAWPGYSYSDELDAFIPPKQDDSWILNTEKKEWEPSMEKPKEGATDYIWDNELNNWKPVYFN